MKPIVAAKFKALAVHLVVTGLVTAISAVFVYLVWYPDDLYKYLKGGELYKLIVTVELVLGPLMTLVIFSPYKPKKELVLDYFLVGALQFSALAYGLYSTFISRPVFEVFVIDRIEFIAATELEDADLALAESPYNVLPVAGYKTVCVERPTDVEERNNLLFTAVAGKDIELYPRYYRECVDGEIVAAAYPGERLEEAMRVKGDLGKYGARLPSEKFGWLPVKSRFGAWVKVYPGEGAENAYYLDFDPWEVPVESK
ncbi:hypothetical protein HCU74_15760 [Spongiibacter sp. KMU-166]|uniref:Fimbrial protein n=1 Tax=Spongiibacter thalassae TaxID=2721624 RepID=A0ABX1GI39_9GAMM|nr:hypothetical protein [Spongiibacter thalassae]NKI18865.1 hypothetical protein [Spongiibacter thalassae]